MTRKIPIRVFLADDHPVVRAGAAGLLSREPGIEVVRDTGDGGEVERLVEETAPDVLVLDVSMPGLDPIAVTRRLIRKRPALRVLVLSAYSDEAYVIGLLSAGATGYVMKDEALESLVGAIRAVARGESWLSQRIAGQLAKRAIGPNPPGSADAISEREREVLHLLALGLPNDGIADALFISKRTVQNHVSNIYAKLELGSRAEAVLYAIRHGIVEVGEVKNP